MYFFTSQQSTAWLENRQSSSHGNLTETASPQAASSKARGSTYLESRSGSSSPGTSLHQGAVPARLAAQSSPRASTHGAPGNALDLPRMRYNLVSAAPIMGATWFRRGLQSSVGHTEDQLPRKSNWKRNSRQRRQLRPSRLIPARLCTGFLVGRV